MVPLHPKPNVAGGRVLARIEGSSAVTDDTFMISCHGKKDAYVVLFLLYEFRLKD